MKNLIFAILFSFALHAHAQEVIVEDPELSLVRLSIETSKEIQVQTRKQGSITVLQLLLPIQDFGCGDLHEVTHYMKTVSADSRSINFYAAKKVMASTCYPSGETKPLLLEVMTNFNETTTVVIQNQLQLMIKIQPGKSIWEIPQYLGYEIHPIEKK